MLKELLKHEVRSLLKSNRVVWSLLVFVVMFILVFWIRVDDFKQQRQAYIADQQMFQEQEKATGAYSFIRTRAIFPPVLFSVYHEGRFVRMGHLIDNVIFDELYYTTEGNSAAVRLFRDTIKLDITTLIVFFLSLFILLNTFDSVNGEKRSGTLRLLMTFELKRSHFLLKKIAGTLMFVGLVFLIPYFLSLIILIIVFPSLITFSFLFQWVIYLIGVIIFSLCFILLGVWTSLLTRNPGKSLVFALFCWIGLLMILPLVMTQITNKLFISPRELQSISKEREIIANDITREKGRLTQKYNFDNMGHMMWNGNGDFNQIIVFSILEVERTHVNYNKFYYKDVFPLIKKSDQLYIKRDQAEDRNKELSQLYQFYNPRTCFMGIAENISGCSKKEYHQFLNAGANLRDKVISQGVKDNWLLSRAFFAVVDTSYIYTNDNLWATPIPEIERVFEKYPFKFKMPVLPKYEYSPITPGQMFSNTWLYFLYSVVFILGFFLWDLNLIKKYDIR